MIAFLLSLAALSSASAQELTVPPGYDQPAQPQGQPTYVSQPVYGQPLAPAGGYGTAPVAPAPPPSNEPQREGFTVELSLGLALTQVERATPCGGVGSVSCSELESFFGIAPLAVGIGFFATPGVAILFRASGTSFFDGGLVVLGHYGLSAQFWANDWLMMSVGPALALLGDVEGDGVLGFGIDARIGFSFLSIAHHSLRVALELFPSFFEEFAMGEALSFEWQFY
jgi:hypothetical protein